MEVNLIIGIVFGVLFVIFATVGTILRKNATVEKLGFLPNEQLLFEEDGVRVDQKFRGEGIATIYRNAFVRATNQRIIIAQTPWFGKKIHYLISVIHYTGEKGPDLENYGGIFLKGAASSKGFMTFYTTKDQIITDTSRTPSVVQITVPMKDPGPFLKAPRILIYSETPEKYKYL